MVQHTCNTFLSLYAARVSRRGREWHVWMCMAVVLACAVPAAGQYCLDDWGLKDPAPRVLLVAALESSHTSDVQAQLQGVGGFSAVDVFDARSSAPSASLLRQYHVVFAWSVHQSQDTVGVGNALADFWDQGGDVVLAQWTTVKTATVGGRFGDAGQGYLLLQIGESHQDSDFLGLRLEPQSPLLRDVRFLGASAAAHSKGALATGSVEVARWASSGQPLVVRRNQGCRGMVLLNLWPVSSAVVEGWMIGDVAALMRNALLFSTCRCCPPGSYVANGTCSNCSAGTYSTGSGTSACSACSAGTYGSALGSSTCSDCTSGTYATATGATACGTARPGVNCATGQANVTAKEDCCIRVMRNPDAAVLRINLQSEVVVTSITLWRHLDASNMQLSNYSLAPPSHPLLSHPDQLDGLEVLLGSGQHMTSCRSMPLGSSGDLDPSQRFTGWRLMCNGSGQVVSLAFPGLVGPAIRVSNGSGWPLGFQSTQPPPLPPRNYTETPAPMYGSGAGEPGGTKAGRVAVKICFMPAAVARVELVHPVLWVEAATPMPIPPAA